MDRTEMIRRIVDEGASIDEVVKEHFVGVEGFRQSLVEKSVDPRETLESRERAYKSYNTMVQKSQEQAIEDARVERNSILEQFERAMNQTILKDEGQHDINTLEVQCWESHPELAERLRKCERTIDGA